MTSLAKGHFLALLIPTALIAGALGSQYLGGLHPCEMCLWQRWPHYAAIGLALLAFRARPVARPLALLAGLAILVSGGIGVFHAGVEYGWWEGLTTCSTTSGGGSADDILKNVMSAPLVRCDEVQWSLFGVSLAGYNALISILGGLAVLWLSLKRA